MIWLWLGLAYALIALAVACFGAFGIAVTKWDRYGRTYAAMPGYWTPEQIMAGRSESGQWEALHSGVERQGYQYRYDRVALLWATGAVSVFWPVGLPLYFATRKGHLIADELAKRDAA